MVSRGESIIGTALMDGTGQRSVRIDIPIQGWVSSVDQLSTSRTKGNLMTLKIVRGLLPVTLTLWLATTLGGVHAAVAGEKVTTASLAQTEVVVAPANHSPFLLVEDITAKILNKIEAHRALVEASSSEVEKEALMNAFFTDVEAIMASAVDFDWIARNVMGPYGKQATKAQRELFARTFRDGLVETYGRGLLSYRDQQIVVLPGADYEGKRKVSVQQEIRSVDGNYPLEYSMGLSKSGQWKVINVIINGINLGKTFRNQFVQAAQKNGGDIDAVIAGWDSSHTG